MNLELKFDPNNILNQAESLVDILQERAKYQPNKIAYKFLKDGEIEDDSLTYQELDQKARMIAASLQSQGASGERALLLYQPGLEFISAFFGCLYAQVIAVPAYPPRRNQNLLRLQSIIEDAQASVVLTTSSIFKNMEQQLENSPLANLSWLTTDLIDNKPALEWKQPNLTKDSLAFLQYTSGSTSAPKGVMVTHGNLLHNEEMLKIAFAHNENTVFVVWLPLFHDMGLIGQVLQSFYIGASCVLMSPVAFLQKPIRWLQAISRYRATTSGAPNFAYQLCIEKTTPEQRANLDLSSWQVAFNGAEPVRADTIEKFASVFAPYGFKREALYPCYGMAETTLFVTGNPASTDPVIIKVKSTSLEKNHIEIANDFQDNTTSLVSSGQKWLEQQIAIADPKTLRQCGDNYVGEIWVKGGSVAQGYWRREQKTQETFQAYLSDTHSGPFLRTGDLGFMRDGQLFVTGRLKDLIIVRGRNHYPQDIELTVEKCHPALRVGAGAAFTVEIAGEPRLVIAQEVERTYLRKLNQNEIFDAIRNAVSQNHELQVYGIVLLKTAHISKTSSGKIQRSACAQGFLDGTLNAVATWTLDEEDITLEEEITLTKQSSNCSIHDWMKTWLAKQLKVRVDKIDINKSFADYGLDSMAAVELAQDLSNWLGKNLDVTITWNFPTIEALANYLEQEQSTQELPTTIENIDPKEELSEDEMEAEIAKTYAQLQTLLMEN